MTQKTETRTHTYTSEVITEHKCDWCGKSAPNPGDCDWSNSFSQEDKVRIRRKYGVSDPDGGGYKVMENIDLCSYCWEDVLLPFFEERRGIKPRIERIDH